MSSTFQRDLNHKVCTIILLKVVATELTAKTARDFLDKKQPQTLKQSTSKSISLQVVTAKKDTDIEVDQVPVSATET